MSILVFQLFKNFNDKIPKIYFIFTIFSIILIFAFLYSGNPHHYLTFWIFLLVAYWIAEYDSSWNTKKEKLITYIIYSIFLLLPQQQYIKYYFVPNASNFIKELNINVNQNSVTYLPEANRYMLPYIIHRYKVLDMCTKKEFNWQTYSEPCEAKLSDYSDLFKNIPNNNENLLILRNFASPEFYGLKKLYEDEFYMLCYKLY